MICPTCQAGGQRSTVRVVRTTDPKLTKEHFWDEDGQEHFHNPSIIVTELECSRGHRFAERSSWQCGACGYAACAAEFVLPSDDPPAAVVTLPRQRSTATRLASSRNR